MNKYTDSLAVLLDDTSTDKGESKLKVVQEIAENFEVNFPSFSSPLCITQAKRGPLIFLWRPTDRRREI